MNNIIQDSTANIKQHFDKYRALSLGELYCFLNNCFKDYIEYSSFVVYIEQNSSLHIPRCVFSDKKRKIRVLPILIINQNSSHYNILIINNDIYKKIYIYFLIYLNCILVYLFCNI